MSYPLRPDQRFKARRVRVTQRYGKRYFSYPSHADTFLPITISPPSTTSSHSPSYTTSVHPQIPLSRHCHPNSYATLQDMSNLSLLHIYHSNFRPSLLVPITLPCQDDNTRNINELEEKLARLESQPASIIEALHQTLPQGTLTVKRRSLELLQEFLFLMHYRNESRSSRAFEVDRPENAKARRWIERGMKAEGIQSAADMWRRILRYHLDSSHSDLMREGAKVIPPVTYHTYVDDYFLSIWEAAQGEEFILTHNAFGLSEGFAGSCPALHRIFVLSPRIAVVMCNVRLRPDAKRYTRPGSLESSLLSVNPAPPAPIYAGREDSIWLFAHPRSSWKEEIDSFEFKITKLTRP
ncbi:hypothetical protein EV702DRAFT_1194876 [Suillus placidus]|uniref:Uncharacterized protein n=1 Tax=Suillus placidus TaxID=48579 RepID=A0A9P7D4M1_9AGAM|nr:hypothetical protein EV702DRAFT_1194876 [Suillus placidus]